MIVLRWLFSAINSLVKRANLAAGPSSTSDDDDCDAEFCKQKRKNYDFFFVFILCAHYKFVVWSMGQIDFSEPQAATRCSFC